MIPLIIIVKWAFRTINSAVKVIDSSMFMDIIFFYILT